MCSLTRHLPIGGLLGLLVAVGCGKDTTGPILSEPPSLQLRTVLTGLPNPIDLVGLPGGDRTFLALQDGHVHEIEDGALVEPAALDLRGVVSDVSTAGRGLLSIAFDPRGLEAAPFLFVSYTTTAPDDQDETTSFVSRFRWDGDGFDRNSEEVVFQLEQSLGDHNAGHILFGPDGYLYLSLGDGGSGAARGEAQNPNHFGTVLRLDVATLPYRIPTGNPFRDHESIPPEVWVRGLRNPWRIGVDAATGDLWIGDVGESRWEEVNLARSADGGGQNFGWAVMEGEECFESSSCDHGAYDPPTLTYGRDEGCSIIGGTVYRGSIDGLEGEYFFADFCEGWIRSIRADGSAETVTDWTSQLDLGGEPPVAFAVDGPGELYVLTLEGTVFRVEERAGG